MNLARVVKNLFFLLVLVFSSLMLVIITFGVAAGAHDLAPFDTGIESAIAHFRTPLLTSIMLIITNVGSPFVLTMISIVLAVILIAKRDVYDTMLYMVSIALSIASFIIMKNALGIPRPAQSLLTELSGWSFPSGHATVATAFFFVTAYSFFGWFRDWRGKAALVVGCFAAVAVIGFSRVYLVAHFALDVLAGMALGLLTVSLTIIVFNVFLSEKEWWRRRVRSF